MSMIFQSYALWPHMTVAENVAYGLKLRKLDRAEIERRVDAILGTTRARRAGGALSRRALRRPAAARGAGARAGRRAGDPAAGRAAVQPRRQSARGDALRDPPPARHVSATPRSMSPTTRRGDDHRRPDRRDEPRPHRAGRLAGRHLRAAALGVRRPLHRRQQHHPRQRWDGGDTVDCGHGLALRCGSGEFARERETAVSIRHHDIGITMPARRRRRRQRRLRRP